MFFVEHGHELTAIDVQVENWKAKLPKEFMDSCELSAMPFVLTGIDIGMELNSEIKQSVKEFRDDFSKSKFRDTAERATRLTANTADDEPAVVQFVDHALTTWCPKGCIGGTSVDAKFIDHVGLYNFGIKDCT